MDVSNNLTKSNNLLEETSVRTDFNDNQISKISTDFDKPI